MSATKQLAAAVVDMCERAIACIACKLEGRGSESVEGPGGEEGEEAGSIWLRRVYNNKGNLGEEASVASSDVPRSKCGRYTCDVVPRVVDVAPMLDVVVLSDAGWAMCSLGISACCCVSALTVDVAPDNTMRSQVLARIFPLSEIYIICCVTLKG